MKMIDVKELLKSGHSIDEVLGMLKPEVEKIAEAIEAEKAAALAAEKTALAKKIGGLMALYARDYHANELVAQAFEAEDVEESLDEIMGKYKTVSGDMDKIMNFLKSMGL